MTPAELGMLFPIRLREYDSGWITAFLSEKKYLQQLFSPGEIERITHIGSTSVVGLKAKPIVDILLEVSVSVPDRELISRLRRAGYHYIPRPENPPPHMMYVKGYTIHGFEGQTIHIHVRYLDDWDELWFCEYLRTDKEAARAYERLKTDLASRYRNDREGYTNAKTGFIRDAVTKARSLSLKPRWG